MNSNEARALFKNNDLSYCKIGSVEIYKLRELISEELKFVPESRLKMKLSKVMDLKFMDDGTIYECYMKVNGPYFKKREAISFNRDRFIGFCGWASSANEKPFTDAFEKWVSWMVEER